MEGFDPIDAPQNICHRIIVVSSKVEDCNCGRNKYIPSVLPDAQNSESLAFMEVPMGVRVLDNKS